VLAGSIVLAALFTAATYLFRPVYAARTVLTLDGELARVLKGLNDGYPSLTGTDYIRQEYFATHSLTQMEVPEIAAKLIDARRLRARDGRPIYEGDLVNPGLATLVYNNRGRGVALKWIADTQQFAVSGLSPDPQEAVELSREYTELFLARNSVQYREACVALAARFADRIATLEKGMGEADRAIEEIQNRYGSIDIAEEAVQVSHRIEEIRQELDGDQLTERTYATRVAEAEAQAAKYQELIPYQASIEANPRIASLKSELQQLVQDEAAASVDYTPEHPTVVALQRQIATVRATLKEEGEKSFQAETKRMPSTAETVWQSLLELRNDHLVYQFRIEHFTRLRELYLQRLRELTAATRELSPLTTKLESLTTLRTEALRELGTVQSLSEHLLPFFRVVSPAAVNTGALKKYRYFPKRRALALGTLVGGFFALALLAIARELYRDRFFAAGQLPRCDGAAAALDGGALPAGPGASDEASYGLVRQACVALRDAPLVTVASLSAGEDAQVPARVLAWSHAHAGRPVVLIDADVVNRPLTGALGLDGRPGVADVLAGRVSLGEALVRDAIPGVAVLPAGSGSATGRDFALLVEEAGRSGERVIVIAPPSAEDAALCDALPPHRRLLVAAWGRHGCEALTRFVGAGAPAGAAPVLVVTQVPALPDPTTLGGLFALAGQTGRAAVSWAIPRRS
jgi:uncharacterized protein involved in exopolysaccharide biosynthesis